MKLDKSHNYVFRIGSDNQYRLHWNEGNWHYEFLAGGVLFDKQVFGEDVELIQALSGHGLKLEQFQIDDNVSPAYSKEIQEKMKKLTAMGIEPCQKHGLMAKNMDGTCEACENTDYPDDFKGTEG